jgi:transcriptional antiterminator
MVEKQESKFLNAKDIAVILDVSESSAYRIIKKLNAELMNHGKIVIAGKISRRYFEEKIYM